MSPTKPDPERIALSEAEDVRDVVHRAVACLAQGGMLGLPHEGAQFLAASSLYPEAVARCRASARGGAPCLLLRSGGEAADWVRGLGTLADRLGRRGWPGPLVLRVEAGEGSTLLERLDPRVRGILVEDGRISLAEPAPGLLREIIRLIPGPVVAFELGETGATEGEPDADLVIDSGPLPARDGLTTVRVQGETWSIERVGRASADEVAAMACVVWLFVCTGNTCRSPMAEALCKTLLARHLGCEPGGLVERGFLVTSAGVGAADGRPAALHAIDVISARGGSLKGHASRHATPDLLRNADLIIGLSSEHVDAILDAVPDIADRTRMLHTNGLDIADPVGLDRSTYEATAREIEEHVARLIRDNVPITVPGR